MIFAYIQTVTTKKNLEIPFRICVSDSIKFNFKYYTIRPQKVISKALYEINNLDRIMIINSAPFCDVADDIIELIKDRQLVFKDNAHFQLLKSQFKNIGYNFNIKPKLIWNNYDINKLKSIGINLPNSNYNSLEYAEKFLGAMIAYVHKNSELLYYQNKVYKNLSKWEWSEYKFAPGVYYFLNDAGDIIYVGKAKNIRKRLQSHFSENGKLNKIIYSEVDSIDVYYTGSDFIAQLVETTEIKRLKPKFNIQQKDDSAPYIINIGTTAKGINKLAIVRKDFKDTFPEKYFNRNSVKYALVKFCKAYNLCRKHCGIETVKGPCSKSTLMNKECVCDGSEKIEDYNKRFSTALMEFLNRKTRKLYKLRGRNTAEDAFVYTVNGIYQGYGFIEKSERIGNENDILGYLIPQKNNYESSRVLESIERKIKPERILIL